MRRGSRGHGRRRSGPAARGDGSKRRCRNALSNKDAWPRTPREAGAWWHWHPYRRARDGWLWRTLGKALFFKASTGFGARCAGFGQTKGGELFFSRGRCYLVVADRVTFGGSSLSPNGVCLYPESCKEFVHRRSISSFILVGSFALYAG